MGEWLCVSEQPVKADVIVCLSAGTDRVIKAADLYRKGFANTVMVTSKNSADLMAICGVPAKNVIMTESGEDTFDEALQVKRVVDREKFRSILVVSNPYHMRRVRWTYRHLFIQDSVLMTFVASAPCRAKGPWWDCQENREVVLREVPANIYYRIMHGLLGIRENPQWVLDLDDLYSKLVQRSAAEKTSKKDNRVRQRH